MIDGNQLREEFGRYLAEHKATRWGMDAALMHVCKIAYDAGKADGPGAALYSREYEIEVPVEPGIYPLKFAAPAPASVEVLGETCIDGGKCHHACTDRCFRRACCSPLSGYVGPWEYTQAEVPMPEPVAYGITNTAITGHTNRLMMVRIAVPLDDQYAGAHWLPLVLADDARTYGGRCRAAGEAAGYARGVAEGVARTGLTPAEVPMPEPDYRGPAEAGDYFSGYTHTTMRTYGAAREAAGYARGLKEAGRLISLWLKDPDVQRMLEFARDALRKFTSWPDRLNGEAEDALRGEVK